MEKKIWYFRLILLVLFFFNFQLFSKDIITPTEFSEKSIDELFVIVQNLSDEDSKNLIFQIREQERAKYKDIDKFYLLISHLAEITAIKKEQKRLESLNLVYALGLLLFLAVLVFVFIKQRKEISIINSLLKEKK